MIGFRIRLSNLVVAVSVVVRFTCTSCAELIAAFDFDFELFGIVFILSLKIIYFCIILIKFLRK